MSLALPLGVIEGFYGRVWRLPERLSMIDFLAQNHFSSYCYAPKADICLRKEWNKPWSEQELADLMTLSAHCRQRNIQFTIGLSPLGLYEEWRAGKGRNQLAQRLQQIALLEPYGLALLFDDMQGDLPQLAQTQADIAHFVADSLALEQLVLCPSYYSFDPILEQLFGKMPDNYWQDLGKCLCGNIDFFWTGDKVISSHYPAESLSKISELLQRKPVIWDNSIVNDGRKTSPFLTVRAMFDLGELEQNAQAVWVNPMNAPALSQIPLASLLLSGNAEQRFLAALDQQCPDMKEAVLQCLDLFNNKGRDQLTINDIEQVNRLFRGKESPVARNIVAWLDGEYQFDPACLT